MAAITETDSKKVVALSTLSQLGLMIFSLSLGGVMLCFFHVIRHALSKANLFLVVGGLLHQHFSQQDARAISSGRSNGVTLLSRSVRIAGLAGLRFSSGFYSKELVLCSGHYSLFSRVFSWLLIVTVIALTLGYCLKLMAGIVVSTLRECSQCPARILYVLPIIALASLRVVIGFSGQHNITPIPQWTARGRRY